MAYRMKAHRKHYGILDRISLTNWIIIITTAFFFIFYIAAGFSSNISKYLVLQPDLFVQGYFWTFSQALWMEL